MLHRSSSRDDPDEQYNDCDDEQDMNKSAGIKYGQAEQPSDEEYYN